MATRTKWPKIPAMIQGAGGPITIKLVKRTTGNHGEACWGTWESSTRIVRLDRSARREHQWRTLYHELTHAALDDSGIAYLLSEPGNESICEAMATSRMQELRASLSL